MDSLRGILSGLLGLAEPLAPDVHSSQTQGAKIDLALTQDPTRTRDPTTQDPTSRESTSRDPTPQGSALPKAQPGRPALSPTAPPQTVPPSALLPRTPVSSHATPASKNTALPSTGLPPRPAANRAVGSPAAALSTIGNRVRNPGSRQQAAVQSGPSAARRGVHDARRKEGEKKAAEAERAVSEMLAVHEVRVAELGAQKGMDPTNAQPEAHPGGQFVPASPRRPGSAKPTIGQLRAIEAAAVHAAEVGKAEVEAVDAAEDGHAEAVAAASGVEGGGASAEAAVEPLSTAAADGSQLVWPLGEDRGEGGELPWPPSCDSGEEDGSVSSDGYETAVTWRIVDAVEDPGSEPSEQSDRGAEQGDEQGPGRAVDELGSAPQIPVEEPRLERSWRVAEVAQPSRPITPGQLGRPTTPGYFSRPTTPALISRPTTPISTVGAIPGGGCAPLQRPRTGSGLHSRPSSARLDGARQAQGK